jgi:ABC-2 type transport system permease protein
MNAVRIRAVMRRHWIVLRRSPHRWFEISFWPLMDVLLWGSLGAFVAKSAQATTRAGTPYLLAGLMLFWTFTQAQFSIALGVNEETWTRNLLNVLTTPVTELEYIVGIALFGVLKLALCLATLTVSTIIFFGFDLSKVGWSVIPIAALLVVNGWALAMLVVGLVLRFGQSAEILIWGLNYVLLAFSGVFFPAGSLPRGLRHVAEVLPTTKAFAALRAVLDGRGLSWATLGGSAIGSAMALIGGITVASWLLRVFRRRGFVTRYS